MKGKTDNQQSRKIDDDSNNAGIYNKHVQEYVDRFMSLEMYRDTFDYFLEVLPANARILELGCGPGNVIKYLRSKRGDLVFHGIDLAPEMIKEAERQNPGVEFDVMDIRHINGITKQFDAIVAAFCVPYIPAAALPDVFRNFSMLVESKGLLYLSLMEGARSRSGLEKTSFTGDDEVYINYYERDEIDNLLKANGFSIEEFYTKDYPETDGSVTIDLIYIARKSS